MSISSKSINLTKGPIFSSLVKMALPIMGTSFIQMAYNLTDMFWIGFLGSNAVAAVGIAGFFIWMSFAFILLSKVGTEVKVAQATGAGNEDEAEEFARSGLMMNFIISILYGMILIIFNKQIIGFFNTRDAYVDLMSRTYLIIIAIGMIFSFSNQVFTGIFNGRGDSRSPFKANALGLLINMILDPILILGIGSFKGLGVAGAAIATVLAQATVFFIFVYNIRFKHALFKSFMFWGRLEKRRAIAVIRMGFPPGLQSGFFTFISIVVARFVANYGATPIAVQKVGSQIEAISWMTATGFAVALGAFVGQNYGAGQSYRVIEGYKKAIQIAFALGVFNTMLLFFGAKWLFMIFIREPEAILQGIDYLKILAVSQLFMCIEITSSGAFNGIGKTKPPAIISIVFNILRIPMAYYLSLYTPLGLNGIWWAITISSIFKGVLVYGWFNIVVKPKLILS